MCLIGLGVYGIGYERVGSGTIIDQDGTILTCTHVVNDIKGIWGAVKGKVSVFGALYVLSPLITCNNDFFSSSFGSAFSDVNG